MRSRWSLARRLPQRRHPSFDWAPAPLMPHLRPGMDWRRVVGNFEEIRLDLPGDFHRVSLLRLEPGRGLPQHKHSGYEYTVVLQGGYTDETGNYGVGDFAVGPGSEQHEPIADPGEPCIAMIVVEKPIVLTGPWGRLVQSADPPRLDLSGPTGALTPRGLPFRFGA